MVCLTDKINFFDLLSSFKKVKNMYKKIIFLLFLVILILLFLPVSKCITDSNYFYYFSFLLLIIGFLLYPKDRNFKFIQSVLIFPFIFLILFDLCNILFINNFNVNLSILNIFFGLLGFAEFHHKLQKEYESLKKYLEDISKK